MPDGTLAAVEPPHTSEPDLAPATVEETELGRGGPAAPTPAPRRRFGLTGRIVVIAGGSVALVAIFLAVSFGRDVRKLLEEELTGRGRMAALSVANTSSNLLFSQDLAGLATLTAATLADIPGAAYVIVRDERGLPLAEAAQPGLGDARPAAIDAEALTLGTRVLEQTIDVGGQKMLHVVALVVFKAGSDEQYLDPLGLAPAGGAGSAGVKVLGSIEIGFPLADLSARIAAATRRSMGLATVVFVACLLAMIPLVNLTTRPLAALSKAALGIAEGDLRQDVHRAGSDEIAELARSFARMVAELQSMLGDLQEAAASLAEDADTMLAGATRQAASASQQAASLAQMNAAIQEIAHTSSAATDHADRVIASTQSAEESSRAGEELVEQAVVSTNHVEAHVSGIESRLSDLTGRAGQIGAIIATVKDVAQRTNVLALNAAIQAVRAGGTGASFSVIAREMRSLAEQSSATAGEVPKLLGDIVDCTQSAAQATRQGSDTARSTAALAQKAGATIGNLAAICRDSATAARQIAESSRQQATGVNEIVAALAELAQTGDASVKSSEEMRRVAERLKAVSGRLVRLSDRYRR
jgi:methyl-accepting chemotaxis protein